MSVHTTDRPTYLDLQIAIHGLNGILCALAWNDDDMLHGFVAERDLHDRRADLIAAGRTICESLAQRF